jgi:hypothetical protein
MKITLESGTVVPLGQRQTNARGFIATVLDEVETLFDLGPVLLKCIVGGAIDSMLHGGLTFKQININTLRGRTLLLHGVWMVG